MGLDATIRQGQRRPRRIGGLLRPYKGAWLACQTALANKAARFRGNRVRDLNKIQSEA
jgi:hypothetical protein